LSTDRHLVDDLAEYPGIGEEYPPTAAPIGRWESPRQQLCPGVQHGERGPQFVARVRDESGP
jgi:hypothetical protein